MSFFLVSAKKKDVCHANEQYVADHLHEDSQSKSLVEYDPGFRARMAYVRSWKCQYCNGSFVSEGELLSHLETPHGIGHSRTYLEHTHRCIECSGDLLSKVDLLRHAHEQQYRPYGCSCGAFFSRIDGFNRHLKSLGNDVPQYPCTFCKCHR